MANYDEILNALTRKYDLTLNSNILENSISKAIDEIRNKSSKKRLAVWGAGEHTTYLFNILSDISDRFVCVIDNNPKLVGLSVNGIPIVGKESITDFTIDSIIISSYTSQEEIRKEIMEEFPQYEILTIYEERKEENKVLFYPYPLIYMDRSFDFYITIHNLKWRFESTKDPKSLLQLIKIFIFIRDFISIEQYCRLYISNKFERSEALAEFLKELDTILTNLKEALERTKLRKNIMMVVLDGLRAKDISNGNMPFLKQLAQNSLSFSNMFSTSNYTKACLLSMFYKSQIIDDGLHHKEVALRKRSPIFLYLKQNKYRMYQHSKAEIIPQDEHIKLVQGDEYGTEENLLKGNLLPRYRVPLTRRLWNSLCEMARDTQVNQFHFIHCLESHFPFICAHMDGEINPLLQPVFFINEKIKFDREKVYQQYLQCIRYMDKQINYYYEFVKNNLYWIICSDHGGNVDGIKPVGHVLTWYDDVIQVPLIIHQKDVSPMGIESLESMQDFSDILIQVLTKNKYQEVSRESVIIQRDPLYGKKWRETDNSQRVGKFGRGYKVVRTAKEKYVLYDTGEEEFYILPNEDSNVINELKDAERIEYVRSLLKNKDFPYMNQ